jgi:hypothetical protein
MKRYAVNPQEHSRKLHKDDCNRLKDALKFNVNFNLSELLSECNFKVDYCVCLNKDKKAQSAVNEHNKNA